jgi:hypothetical protein
VRVGTKRTKATTNKQQPRWRVVVGFKRIKQSSDWNADHFLAGRDEDRSFMAAEYCRRDFWS